MPKLTSERLPKYRKHATGQGLVVLNGREHYLGRHATAASRAEYEALVAQWLANGRQLPKQGSDILIVELLLAYLKFAKGYHQPKEQEKIKLSIRPLRALYGRQPAASFGPLALRAVRQAMIDSGLARSTINCRVNCLRAIFRWAVERELVPPSVLQGLQAVSGLKFGRSGAKETEPVQPVADWAVDGTLEHLPPTVRAMVGVQRLSGMRSGELVQMRACDINMSAATWVYQPQQHKTLHKGHQRLIFLGPQCQALLKPFLTTDTEAFLFSPKASMQQHRATRHAQRKTPLNEGNRPGSNFKRRPEKTPGMCYTPYSYRQAITNAIQAANRARLREAASEGIAADQVGLIPAWHPHQLRHSCATRLRREFGLEVAQAVLGHKSLTAAQLYAEIDFAQAAQAMGKIG